MFASAFNYRNFINYQLFSIFYVSIIFSFFQSSSATAFNVETLNSVNLRGPASGTIVNIDIESYTVVYSDQRIRRLLRDDLGKVLEHRFMGQEDLSIGDHILIKGIMNYDNIIAQLIIRADDLSYEKKPLTGMHPTGRNFIDAKIVATAPVMVELSSGGSLPLKITPYTRIMKERTIRYSDLNVGDKIRILHGKLIRIADEPAKHVNMRSVQQPDYHPELPTPPETVDSKFNAKVMKQKENSPFGFFDPNMLRFMHLSWFGEYAEIMNDLGAHWASFGASFSFNWKLIQQIKNDGRFDGYKWNRFDLLIKHAQANNIHVIGYIKAMEPKPDSPQEESAVPALPRNINEYKKFVSAVVERYDMDGKDDMPGLKYPIKYWSIEDEPLTPKYFEGSGRDYARLLVDAYEAIKAADPHAKVICSMIRGTGWIVSENARDFMNDFFSYLKQSGKKRPYDIMDQHWIGLAKNNEHIQYSFYKNIMEDIDNTGEENGIKPAPYVALEIAGEYENEFLQAIDLFKRHIILLSLGVKRILWSGIQAAPDEMMPPDQKNNYFRKVTLIDGNGNKKLSYFTYKLMTETLNGFDSKNMRASTSEENVFLFETEKDGMPLWSIWKQGETDSTSTIRVSLGKKWKGIKKVEIIETVPSAEKGSEIIDYKAAFHREKKDVKDSRIEFALSDIPLIIRGLK